MADPKELLEEAETLAEEANAAQTEAEDLRTKADADDASEEDKKAAEEAETRAEEAKTLAGEAKKEADSATKEWEKEHGKRFNPLQAALEEERSKRKAERERAERAEEELTRLRNTQPPGSSNLREETLTLDELTNEGVTAQVRKIAREEAERTTLDGVAPLYDTSVQNRKEFWQKEKPEIWKSISEDVESEIQKVKRAGHIPVAEDVDYAVKDAIADLALAGKLPARKRGRTRRRGSSHEILGEEFSHAASSSTTGRRTKKPLSPEEEAERARMGINVDGYLRVKAKREALAKEKATKK